jgi:hypothetical protein
LWWISNSLDWLNRQPDGTQQVIVSALFLALPAIGAFLWWILRRLGKAFTDRRRKRREFEAARARRRLPANPHLGLYDYAVSLQSAVPDATQAIEKFNALMGAIEVLLVACAKEMAALATPQAKQARLRRFGKDLKPLVDDLWGTSLRLEANTSTLVDGYRLMFTEATIDNLDHVAWLRDQKASFRKLAVGFPSAIQNVRRRRDLMLGLRGKDSRLNPIADRYRDALDNGIDCLDRLNDFCADELPSIIDKRITWSMRARLRLKKLLHKKSGT